MRFRTYQGARPGIQQVMQAITAPGGSQDAYNSMMRDMAYVDSAQANVRHSDSETALNQDQLAARGGIEGELAKIAGSLPQGLTPGVISTMMRSSENPNLTDYTGAVRDFGGAPLQRQAADAARGGNSELMNALISIDAGKPYTPYSANEQGLLNTGSGALTATPGSQAKVGALNAQAGASNASADASRALAHQRGFLTVAPGASLYDVTGGGAQPPAGPMAAALAGVPMPEPILNAPAVPPAPQPIGAAPPGGAQPQMLGGPRLVTTAPYTPNQAGMGAGKPSADRRQYDEMIALGVPHDVARGVAYGAVKQVSDGTRTVLVDIASGNIVGSLEVDPKTRKPVWNTNFSAQPSPAAEAPPMPGARKHSDGNWYFRDPSGQWYRVEP